MYFTWVFEAALLFCAVFAAVLCRPGRECQYEEWRARGGGWLLWPKTSKSLRYKRKFDLIDDGEMKYVPNAPRVSGISSANGMRCFFGGALIGLLVTYAIIASLMYIVKGEIVSVLFLKMFLVVQAMGINYAFKREYKIRYGAGSTTYKYLIVSCLLAVGLLSTSANNMFILNLLIDATSLLLGALVALSVSKVGYTLERCTLSAYHYLLVSALTSFMSYLGSLLIFVSARSLNIQMVVDSLDDLSHNSKMLFTTGVLLWCVKLLFLLGIFPFYYYVFNLAGILSLPGNLLFFTASKVPGLFTAYMMSELVAASGLLWLQPALMTFSVLSIVLTAVLFYESVVIKHLLAASSVNTIAFVYMVSLFEGSYPLAVGAMYFVSYSAALCGFIVFLTDVLERSMPEGESEVEDGEVRTVSDLNLTNVFIRARKDRVIAKPKIIKIVEADDLLLSEESLYGKPLLLGRIEAPAQEPDFTRDQYFRVSIAFACYSMLSLGAIPLTAGFGPKLQILGILVTAGFIKTALLVGVVSGISAVWYAMITFKFIRTIWAADGGRSKVTTEQVATKLPVWVTADAEKLSIFFAGVFALLVGLTLFTMQGWFIQGVADGIVLFW